MAISIESVDVTTGAKAKLTIKGWEYERVFILTGVFGSASSDESVYASFLTLGITFGSVHPTITSAYFAEATGRMTAIDVCEITIVYREDFILPNIRVGTTLQSVLANKDYASNAMTLTGTGADGVSKTQNASCTIDMPVSTVVYTRQETGGTNGTGPLNISQQYVGKLNSDTWSLDLGCTARQWRCDAITGDSENGGYTYKVTYSFAYRSQTWDVELCFLDTDGRAVSPTSSSNVKTFQMYNTIDFNGLSLAP